MVCGTSQGGGETRPPFSLVLPKKTLQRGLSCRFAAIHLPGRARSKRKTLWRTNSTRSCRVGRNTGVSVVGAVGTCGVLLECALGWWNIRSSSRICRIGSGFRGRSSQGLYHQPRAFRFATRYVGDSRNVAAAKRGAQPMRLHPPKANRGCQMRH